MGRKAFLAGLFALALVGMLWGCGNDDGVGGPGGGMPEVESSQAQSAAPSETSSVPESSGEYVFDPTESSPFCSSTQGLLEDLLRMGAELPDTLWLPDEGRVKEVFGCSYVGAICQKKIVKINFQRQLDPADQEALIEEYDLADKDSQGYDDRLRAMLSDWRYANLNLDFFSSLGPMEEFPEDGSDYEAVSGHEGYEAAPVLWNDAGEAVRLRVRWAEGGYLFQAELPADCMDAFWEHSEEWMTEQETGEMVSEAEPDREGSGGDTLYTPSVPADGEGIGL